MFLTGLKNAVRDRLYGEFQPRWGGNFTPPVGFPLITQKQ